MAHPFMRVLMLTNLEQKFVSITTSKVRVILNARKAFKQKKRPQSEGCGLNF